MTRDEIAKQLIDLSKKLTEHEAVAVKSALALDDAEDALDTAQATLLLSGKVEGKNQETRDAHLREQTMEFRSAVREKRREHALAAGRLRALTATFSAYRNVAKMYHNEER